MTYDLVVWGATGVAGRLVTDYLTSQYGPADLDLALGGRDEERLRAVEAEVTGRYDDWTEIPIVLGDATDQASMHDIARQTEVVCTTVGPYTNYGTPLVEACVREETDYCDLTGEVTWVREMIDRFHEAALDAGTRIVHSCGFDSVPADIGTLLVQSFALDNFGTAADQVRIYLEDGTGGVSGGTLASMAEMFGAASSDPVARQVLENPYALAPRGERDGVDSGEQRRPKRDPMRSVWTAPSPMAMINERVVRRSNALLDYPWGREFRCAEAVPTGDGLGGAASATLLSGGISLSLAGMSVGPIRSALREYVFPDQGDGPTRAETADGSFLVRVRGRGTAPDGQFHVDARIGADLGPGYGATARMVGESAMSLLRDDVESPLPGGVLTPASGIGLPLADRLRDAGMTVEVSEWTE